LAYAVNYRTGPGWWKQAKSWWEGWGGQPCCTLRHAEQIRGISVHGFLATGAGYLQTFDNLP